MLDEGFDVSKPLSSLVGPGYIFNVIILQMSHSERQ